MFSPKSRRAGSVFFPLVGKVFFHNVFSQHVLFIRNYKRQTDKKFLVTTLPQVERRFRHRTAELGALYEYLAELLGVSARAQKYASMAFAERWTHFGRDHHFTKRCLQRQRKLHAALAEKRKAKVPGAGVQREAPEEVKLEYPAREYNELVDELIELADGKAGML